MPVSARYRAASPAATIYGNDYDAACRRYDADAESILLGLWAGNVSLRRDDCLRVGLASSWRVFTQQGDRDFGLRARRAGLVGHFDRDLRAEHRYTRSVAGFLRSSRIQACTDATLRARYPELGAATSPTAGMPRPARTLVFTGRIPLVGSAVRHGVVAAASRLGRWRCSRLTVGVLVVARAIVQEHALARHDVAADQGGLRAVRRSRAGRPARTAS
jgi:hypothetical protein